MKLFLQFAIGISSTVAMYFLLGLNDYGMIAIAAVCVTALVAVVKTHDENAPFLIWISFCVFWGLLIGVTWPAIPMWMLNVPNKTQARDTSAKGDERNV